MKRGVVVEYNDDFVTLLTPDGQFLKTSNKEGTYELGEEISFFPSMDEREEAATRTSSLMKSNGLDFLNSRSARICALSTVAIMVFMLSFFPFFNNDKVYAYMSIDINPSFEVGIDNQLDVVSLDPLNEDAKKMMEQLPEWEDKPFDKIIDAIVGESKEEGYVYPGKEIMITTVINKLDRNIQSDLKEGINEIKTSFEEEEMVVKTIEADNETRDKAQKQGISTGKYIELQEDTNVEEKAKEDVQQPVNEIQEVETEKHSDETSKFDESDKVSVAEAMVLSNQTAKDKLSPDTKDKLIEAKNKLNENNKKIEKQQKLNNQSNLKAQKNEIKKNETKNNVKKQIKSKENNRGNNDKNERNNKENKKIKENKSKNDNKKKGQDDFSDRKSVRNIKEHIKADQ